MATTSPHLEPATSPTVQEDNEEEVAGLASPPRRPRSKASAELRRIILNFTPSWFAVNMGTGIVSILLFTLPYQFTGLKIIADIVFGLNVLLFLLFTLISAARYIIWPGMIPTMLCHTQSAFLGCFSMGMSTIVNMCALSAAPAWGHSFAIFTFALWWINAVVALFVCIGVPFLQFTRLKITLEDINAVFLLPVVSTIVAAASGGIVADILEPPHARLTLQVSYILLGTGLGLAFLIMGIYYLRLAVHKLPPAAAILSVFLPLGPCGQGAFAILKLSSVLWSLSKTTGQALGGSATATAQEAQTMATAVYGVSMVAALWVWGLGCVWLVMAVALFVDLASVSSLKFSITFWSLTFPLGVFATAAIQFSKEFDSGAWRVIATILSLCVVLQWLYVGAMTTYKALKGEIFHSPCLADAGGRPPSENAWDDRRQYKYEPKEKS